MYDLYINVDPFCLVGEWTGEGDQETGGGQPGHPPCPPHQQGQDRDISRSPPQVEK